MNHSNKGLLDSVKALFMANTLDVASFSPQLIASLPTASIEAIIGGLRAKYGSLLRVSNDGEMATAHLERADIPVQVFQDSAGTINGLRIYPEIVTSGSIAEHAEFILSLPGKSSVLVKSGTRTLYTHCSGEPLSVGSAFKLCVLAAVMQAVAAGRFTWEQVFAFREQWRSLPSGILQDWPNDIPLTLMSLCCLMISLSDNSAADALLGIVGRESVESLSLFNRPFLSTREAFVLKEHAQFWKERDLLDRRFLLAEVAETPLPSTYDLARIVASGIGWFFSADELCSLLFETQHHPSLTINSGPILKSRWKRVAFKGGQEPGALNISLLMIDGNDTSHVVIVTHNALEDFNPETVLLRVRAIAKVLEDRSS